MLRHTVFVGLREDKPAMEVRRERHSIDRVLGDVSLEPAKRTQTTLATPGIDMRNQGKVSGVLTFAFALVFLFETWIWGGLVALAHKLLGLIPWVALKARIVVVIDLLPPLAALLLFGIPLVVSEVGSFFSVIMVATGHLLVGGCLYVAMKIVGLGLVAVIFDLTRSKLMSIPWFVVVHAKFLALHDFAHRLVAPYKTAAVASLVEFRQRAAEYWVRVRQGVGAKIRF
jgi:hypothetical protein